MIRLCIITWIVKRVPFAAVTKRNSFVIDNKAVSKRYRIILKFDLCRHHSWISDSPTLHALTGWGVVLAGSILWTLCCVCRERRVFSRIFVECGFIALVLRHSYRTNNDTTEQNDELYWTVHVQFSLSHFIEQHIPIWSNLCRRLGWMMTGSMEPIFTSRSS